MKKKVFATLLAVSMIASMVPAAVSVQAADGDSIRLVNGKIEVDAQLKKLAEMYEKETGTKVEIESMGGGMWTGFFCGFLVDMFYGSVFGFYALIYMYIGFLSGYAHRICYDDDLKVPVMLAGFGDLLYGLSVYALQFLLRGRLGLGTYLYRIILPEIFYTVILTLIVYRLFHYINYHFMDNPSRKESESIWVLK